MLSNGGIKEYYCTSPTPLLAKEIDKMNKNKTADKTKKVPVYNVRMMTDDEWNRLAYKNYLQNRGGRKHESAGLQHGGVA